MLKREPGSDVVSRELAGAIISAVNYTEIVSWIVLTGGDAEFLLDAVSRMGLDIAPFEEEQAVLTGRLIKKTKSFGLSLGDRACLALALQRGLPVMTADRAWRDLDLGVEIRLIR